MIKIILSVVAALGVTVPYDDHASVAVLEACLFTNYQRQCLYHWRFLFPKATGNQ